MGNYVQFWQFFEYETTFHFWFLEKEQFEASILDQLESGGIKKHCLSTYNWMIKGVKLYLSAPEAREAFKKNLLVSQFNLPEVDMMVEVEKEIEHQKRPPSVHFWLATPKECVGEAHGRHHKRETDHQLHPASQDGQEEEGGF